MHNRNYAELSGGAMKNKQMTKEQLIKIRQGTGLNQKDFGVALGFTPDGAQRSMSALETGERPIKPTIAKLATYIKEHGISK